MNNDDTLVQPDPFLNITHELSWEERQGFAGIVVTVKVNGERLTTAHVATVAGSSENDGKFQRRKGLLKDLFERNITWQEFIDLTTPSQAKAAPARRDEDRTAQPLTRIVHHPPGGMNARIYPGMPLHRPELEEIATKKRTPIG